MSPTTLSVFEHTTLRVGTGAAGGGSRDVLTQQQFDALARFNDAHGQRYFRLGHRSITFCNFVGYLQVGKLGIEILPKADRDTSRGANQAHWQGFLLEMLRVSTGLSLHSPTNALQRIGRPTLLDLVALRFISEVERLLHEGLTKGYRDVEANESTFRGRLLGATHVRANIARDDRFFVRYSTFDRDIPINRVLGAALQTLGHHPLTPAVRARVAAAGVRFPEVSTHGVQADLCDRIGLTRSTARYHDALRLACMILQHRAPELQTGRHDVFAVLFDMNALWEHYVGWLFRRAAPEHCEVALQESRAFWWTRPSAPRRVRPDLILRDRTDGRVLLVADAKWKTLRDSAPDDDDLKQMFVYNHLFATNRSVLVYPTVGSGQQQLEGAYYGRTHCGTVELGLFEASRLRTEAMVEQVQGLLARLS